MKPSHRMKRLFSVLCLSALLVLPSVETGANPPPAGTCLPLVSCGGGNINPCCPPPVQTMDDKALLMYQAKAWAFVIKLAASIYETTQEQIYSLLDLATAGQLAMITSATSDAMTYINGNLAMLDPAKLLAYLTDFSFNLNLNAKITERERKLMPDDLSVQDALINQAIRDYKQQQQTIDTLAYVLVFKGMLEKLEGDAETVEDIDTKEDTVEAAWKKNAGMRVLYNDLLTVKQQVLAMRLKAKAYRSIKLLRKIETPPEGSSLLDVLGSAGDMLGVGRL